MSLFHNICLNGDRWQFYFALQLGASATLVDKNKNSPLHYLCHNNKMSTQDIEYLISKGASIEAKDSNGYTPLSLLCCKEKPNLDFIKCLINNKADTLTRDNDGLSILHLVCSHSRDLTIIKYLVETNGNLLNTHSKDVELTPLHLHFFNNNALSLESISYLIEKGATLSKNYDLFTIAAASPNPNITRPILQYLFENEACNKQRRTLVRGYVKREVMAKHSTIFNNIKNASEETLVNPANESILNIFCLKEKPKLDCITYLLERDVPISNITTKKLISTLTIQFAKDEVNTVHVHELMKMLLMQEMLGNNKNATLFKFLKAQGLSVSLNDCLVTERKLMHF